MDEISGRSGHEERDAGEELEHDAAEGPHVNGLEEALLEDNLWCSVEPALDIGEGYLGRETGRTEINDSDSTLLGISEHNVLRLQIAVDDIDILEGHEGQGKEDLLTDGLHQGELNPFVF